MDYSKVYLKINGKWYDCTYYLKVHPGGVTIMYKYNMRDATYAFNDERIHLNNDHINLLLKTMEVREPELIEKLDKSMR